MTMPNKDRLVLIQQICAFSKAGDDPVRIPRSTMKLLLKAALADVFDEEWYKRRNTDVTAALKDGVVASAFDHFLDSGLYEGRMPCRIQIDEKDYASKHPDVAKAVAAGHFQSEQEHFRQRGFVEGRSFKLASE